MFQSLRKLTLCAALLASLFVSACADTNMGNKEMGGTAIGAIAGGLAGSQFGGGKGQLVGVGVGTLLGALVGSEVGRSLDKADMAYANQAQNRAYAAPVGQTIQWNNPQSGNSGTITPIRDGRDNATGAYCREYSQTIMVGGRKQEGYGTACRQPDGSWKVIN